MPVSETERMSPEQLDALADKINAAV